MSGLQDATKYVFAYYVRGYDHRIYAPVTEVEHESVMTDTIVPIETDVEEEFGFLTTFGFLSFILLLIFNA
jgi:hypothetical protein